MQKHRQIHDILNRVLAEEDDFQRFSTSEDRVWRAFQHANPNKATGPDNTAKKYLKEKSKVFKYAKWQLK